MIRIRIILAGLLITTMGWSADEVPLLVGAPTKKKIFEYFDPAEHAGTGTLTLKSGDSTETIDFGAAAERYAYAMVFHGSILPDPFKSELAGLTVIQITMGNLGTKLEGHVPQFGALSLITTQMPTKARVFRSALPPDSLKKLKDQAIIQITSPAAGRNRTDEDSLKATFYSNQGTVSVEPTGTVEKIQLKGPEGLLNFKTRSLKLSFNSLLATPFNSAGADLTGALTVNAFWPDGKRSESFMKKVALASLGNGRADRLGPPSPVTDMSPSRKITGTGK